MRRAVLTFAASLALVACGGQEPRRASGAIEVAVFSGRPQPAAREEVVAVGAVVVLHVVGLGPARARVIGPDGAEIATEDVPLHGDAGVIGTEQRFTPRAPGVHRVEHAEVSGLELVHLVAR